LARNVKTRIGLWNVRTLVQSGRLKKLQRNGTGSASLFERKIQLRRKNEKRNGKYEMAENRTRGSLGCWEEMGILNNSARTEWEADILLMPYAPVGAKRR
jgi:hypothetical protein